MAAAAAAGPQVRRSAPALHGRPGPARGPARPPPGDEPRARRAISSIYRATRPAREAIRQLRWHPANVGPPRRPRPGAGPARALGRQASARRADGRHRHVPLHLRRVLQGRGSAGLRKHLSPGRRSNDGDGMAANLSLLQEEAFIHGYLLV